MSERPTIYWIQGLGDGPWQNLHHCADHDDAIARMGVLLADQRFRALRLVLARSRDGQIDYTALVETRDGEVVSAEPPDPGLPPTAPPPPPPPPTANWKLRAAVLSGVLVAAIVGGIVIANHNPHLAVALYERTVYLARPDQAKPVTPPVANRIDPRYASRLFAAIDADDEATTRRLMAARPRDLRLDEVHDFVDDGWGTGPRGIVDYALLGGHLATADALLSAGATPSEWVREIITRHAGLAKLRPAIALLMEFGALPEISVKTAMDETNRELSGY